MFQVVLNRQWERRKWKLLVIEDADQFIVSNARQRAGPGLGRLLNLSDGIVGQGMKTLVLITTNEPLGSLHPAVVGPGRCNANIEFSRLGADEARDWLGAGHGLLANGATAARAPRRPERRP